MSIFSFFNFFKSKKDNTDQVTEPEVESEDVIEEESIEINSNDIVEEPIIDETSQEVVEEVVEDKVEEITLDDLPEPPKEETEWIPMEEMIDTLKSKYQSYDLTSFLDFDYATEGQKDGYNIHSSEFLRKKKIYLISEFQRLIEKRVDELKDERLNCKNFIIDMRGLSDQIVEKFQLRVDLCNEYIEDLHKEKELANGCQGLIRSVIGDYEVGWDKGLSDYLQDNYFLNPLKRL